MLGCPVQLNAGCPWDTACPLGLPRLPADFLQPFFCCGTSCRFGALIRDAAARAVAGVACLPLWRLLSSNLLCQSGPRHRCRHAHNSTKTPPEMLACLGGMSDVDKSSSPSQGSPRTDGCRLGPADEGPLLYRWGCSALPTLPTRPSIRLG